MAGSIMRSARSESCNPLFDDKQMVPAGRSMRARLALAVVLAGLTLCWLAPAMAGELRPADEVSSPPPLFIEIIPGDLPLILSAPHGGQLTPDGMPTRVDAVTVNDWRSQELARDLADALEARSGQRPTLVINQLDRSRLDPNRSLGQGAQGSAEAQAAWHAFHQAIADGGSAISQRCGAGLYFELHSHGVTGRWLEFGYGLTADDLRSTDEDLAKARFVVRANVRSLARGGPLTLPDLIRGPDSLGGRMEQAGFRAVPAPGRPEPAGEYFDGGWGVYLHGSRHGGSIDAIQMEAPYDLLADAWRPRLVEALAEALLASLESWYGFNSQAGADDLCGW